MNSYDFHFTYEFQFVIFGTKLSDHDNTENYFYVIGLVGRGNVFPCGVLACGWCVGDKLLCVLFRILCLL